MNAKAHKGGRPKTTYEERDDGRNFERFDSVARHVLGVNRAEIRKEPRRPSATPPAAKSRRKH